MTNFEKKDVCNQFYQHVIASIINTIKMINYSIHHDIKLCSYSVNDSCSLSCIVEMYWYWIFCFIYCYKYNYKLLPCNKYEWDWLGWNRLLASLKKTTLSITSFILLFMQGTKEVYSQLNHNTIGNAIYQIKTSKKKIAVLSVDTCMIIELSLICA